MVRPTIVDVAKAAGVPLMTAYVALRHRRIVGLSVEPLQAFKVLHEAERLGYFPAHFDADMRERKVARG